MSEIKDGGPAFPNVPDGAGDKWADWDKGMTLLDYFAAKAMQGDWAAQSNDTGVWPNDASTEGMEARAKVYYRMADAMIKARSQS